MASGQMREQLQTHQWVLTVSDVTFRDLGPNAPPENAHARAEL